MMSPDASETNRLLAEILVAIQNLDRNSPSYKANGHPQGTGLGTTADWGASAPAIANTLSLVNTESEEDNAARHSLLTSPEAAYVLGSSQYSPRKSEGDCSLWTEQIGDVWTLPRDYRIDLGFQKHKLEKLSGYDLRLHLEALQIFNDNLLYSKSALPSDFPKQRNWLRHFTIEDTSPYPPFASQSYTIGLKESKTIAKSFQDESTDLLKRQELASYPHGERLPCCHADSQAYNKAPWRRLITLQGLSSVILKSSGHHSKWRDKPYQGWRDVCPFLMPFDRELCGAVDANLGCERRDFESKSYFKQLGSGSNEHGASLTFHITFYEIYTHGSEHMNDLWKVGKLYNDPQKRWFRECACTILARSSRELNKSSKEASSRHQYEHWTILHLTPDGYGKPGSAGGHMHLAVLDLVTTSLEKIANRWSELVDFLRALLGGGTSLMDPVYHDHLLFDNEDFSRSRTYFWAINVLTEFEASISANIEQWEEFRDYLAFPQELDQRGLYSSHEWSGKEQRSLLERSDAYCVRLKRYRGFFLNKRAATVALRDGLFNASSVMESRAATRLGGNIKLLTLVSVFFLPLSFCTSLWSTQNGPSNPHTLIFVCVIVGLATYIIVFNLDLLVRTCTNSYRHYKTSVVGSMRQEQDETWKQRGERYDVFQPEVQNTKPTEWFIFVYILWRAFVRPWTGHQSKE